MRLNYTKLLFPVGLRWSNINSFLWFSLNEIRTEHYPLDWKIWTLTRVVLMEDWEPKLYVNELERVKGGNWKDEWQFLFCFVLNFPLKACNKVGCILDWYLQVTDFWKLNVSLSFHGFFPWHKLMNKFIYLLRYETAWFYRLLRGKQDQWIEFQEESVFPSFKDRHISPKFPVSILKYVNVKP